MKNFAMALVLAAACHLNLAAQSGRKGVPSVVKAPPIQQTQAGKEAELSEAAEGYSESAPNAPRRLVVDKNKNRDKQKPAPSSQPAVSPNADAVAGDEEEVIKIDTSLVSIPVSVNDRNGFYIPNLRREEFKIFEDGQEQEVAYFGTTDQPFSVVLLIDVSPSTEYKISEIQDAASAFVRQLKPQDKVMVVQFDQSVDVLQELTGDREKIFRAIRRADWGNGTSIYDAVENTLRKQLAEIEGRKAVVLFSDGVDTTSFRSSFGKSLQLAEESEAVFFPIYYNTYLDSIGAGGGNGPMTTPPILGRPQRNRGMRGVSAAEYATGRAYLTELANSTGGKLFRPDSTPGGLTAAFESIAEELRRQYQIGYYSSNPGQPGQKRQIRVRVMRPKLVVRARDSYIAGTK